MICLFRKDGDCDRLQTTFGVLNGSGIIGCKNFIPLTCIHCVLYSNKECEGKPHICDRIIISKGNDWIGFENENNIDTNRTAIINS